MGKSNSDLDALLRTLNPRLNPGTYAFASLSVNEDAARLSPVATFREAEGFTVIVEESRAREAALDVSFRAAWITLDVRSELYAVGLTAAVATALARAGISCNVVAATFHDHLFVPIERASDALAILKALQELQQ
jgi:hypothetical protein